MTPIVIESSRLVLRTAVAADVASIVRYYVDNRAHLLPYEPARPESFFTEGYWREQVRRNHEDQEAERALRFFVTRKSDPRKVIGGVNFTAFLRGPAQFCLLGYGLAESAQGKGYMTEALEAGIAHVFEERNLHRVMANYMPRNERSGRLLRRLGFVVEGYSRDYLLINGKWEDHVLTSLTNPAWKPAP